MLISQFFCLNCLHGCYKITKWKENHTFWLRYGIAHAENIPGLLKQLIAHPMYFIDHFNVQTLKIPPSCLCNEALALASVGIRISGLLVVVRVGTTEAVPDIDAVIVAVDTVPDGDALHDADAVPTAVPDVKLPVELLAERLPEGMPGRWNPPIYLADIFI